MKLMLEWKIRKRNEVDELTRVVVENECVNPGEGEKKERNLEGGGQ